MTEVGVIGLGYWGPRLVRALRELGVDVAVYDQDAQAQSVVASRCRVREVASYQELLDTTEAVVIATPVRTHYALALQALNVDKHVFVEKPMTSSLDKTETLIQSAKERDLVVFPGHTFLFSPAVVLIKSLIDEGALGPIHSISMQRRNIDSHRSDTSVLLDLAPHDFSILRYWLGEKSSRIQTVQKASRGAQADTAFCNLEFPQGTIANVELGWLSPVKMRATTIIGSKKMVTYDDTVVNPITVYEKNWSISPNLPDEEPISLMLEHFLDCVSSRWRPDWLLDVAVDVAQMIEEAESGDLSSR